MGLEGGGPGGGVGEHIDKWTLGGFCFILQSLIIDIDINLKVNVFLHYKMKNYLH
jgi:hypothetical protein